MVIKTKTILKNTSRRRCGFGNAAGRSGLGPFTSTDTHGLASSRDPPHSPQGRSYRVSCRDRLAQGRHAAPGQGGRWRWTAAAGRCRRLARRPCERSHPDSSHAGPSCGNLRCRLEHIWRRSTAGPTSRSRPRHIGSKSAGISGNACSSDSQHVRRRAGRIRMTLPLMTIG